MKKSTIKKVTKLVLRYITVLGLTDDERLTADNPMNIYFTENIMEQYLDQMNENMQIVNFKGQEMRVIDTDRFESECQTDYVKMTRAQFYSIVKESHRLYKKILVSIDSKSINNSKTRDSFKAFIQDDNAYSEYITEVVNKYKESLLDLIFHCNTKNEELISIKIELLQFQLNEHLKVEDYMKAHEIQQEILALSELIKKDS